MFLLIPLRVLVAACLWMNLSESFSILRMKTIYGVPNSGWTSPQWNWGSAIGTGHDCARISRQRYATRQARQSLVDNLLAGNCETPVDFEEVKLALALFLQKSRWDGSDGGPGGYSEVLEYMAQAERYESTTGTEDECTLRLIEDMRDRFPLLNPSVEAAKIMECILLDKANKNLDHTRRQCCGLVLEAMAFVDNGP